MLVIVALEFHSHKDYLDALSIAHHSMDHVEEDMRYCLLRERGVEARILREENIPFIAFCRETDEILDANVDFEKLDKATTRLFLRARSKSASFRGVECLLSAKDDSIVKHWPKYIVNPERFLGRSVVHTEKAAFMNAFLEDKLTFPLFVKGDDKGPDSSLSLRHVLNSKDDAQKLFVSTQSMPKSADTRNLIPGDSHLIRFQQPDWFCPYRESLERGRVTFVGINFDFIVSDVMQIRQDNIGDSGKEEYRCYVFDGNVHSISRYTDYDKTLKAERDVWAFARDFASDHTHVFPISYVVDVARKEDGSLTVVELNPVDASGRYLHNEVRGFYTAIDLFYNAISAYAPVKIIPVPEPAVVDCDDGKLFLDA
jgi:hypothetical protein